MAAKDPFVEITTIINRRDELSEVGGAHNQKGVEFQRHWSIVRMFELEKSGEQDFLFLFESIQDVAVLNSSIAPTSIGIFQVKKKDRREWAWVDLTSLDKPVVPKPGKKASARTKRSPKPLDVIKGSPIGKLYATLRAFDSLKAVGRFVSNNGSDLPLANGGNAATSLPVALSDLSAEYQAQLIDALQTLHASGDPSPDLSSIHIERVALSVDDPRSYVIGAIQQFLLGRCPKHAGQATSLLDSLMGQISPLGAKTDSCGSFEELKAERGFSREQFCNALADLQTVPDVDAEFERWLNQLIREGLGFNHTTEMRVAAAGIYRRQLKGARLADEDRLMADCDDFIVTHAMGSEIRPFFEAFFSEYSRSYPSLKRGELYAHLALRAISQCVDQACVS